MPFESIVTNGIFVFFHSLLRARWKLLFISNVFEEIVSIISRFHQQMLRAGISKSANYYHILLSCCFTRLKIVMQKRRKIRYGKHAFGHYCRAIFMKYLFAVVFAVPIISTLQRERIRISYTMSGEFIRNSCPDWDGAPYGGWNFAEFLNYSIKCSIMEKQPVVKRRILLSMNRIQP